MEVSKLAVTELAKPETDEAESWRMIEPLVRQKISLARKSRWETDEEAIRTISLFERRLNLDGPGAWDYSKPTLDNYFAWHIEAAGHFFDELWTICNDARMEKGLPESSEFDAAIYRYVISPQIGRERELGRNNIPVFAGRVELEPESFLEEHRKIFDRFDFLWRDRLCLALPTQGPVVNTAKADLEEWKDQPSVDVRQMTSLDGDESVISWANSLMERKGISSWDDFCEMDTWWEFLKELRKDVQAKLGSMTAEQIQKSLTLEEQRLARLRANFPEFASGSYILPLSSGTEARFRALEEIVWLMSFEYQMKAGIPNVGSLGVQDNVAADVEAPKINEGTLAKPSGLLIAWMPSLLRRLCPMLRTCRNTELNRSISSQRSRARRF